MNFPAALHPFLSSAGTIATHDDMLKFLTI